MARAAQTLLRPDTLIAPIPLHWGRMLSRRFNQSALLAQGLARETGLPWCPDLLTRLKRTQSLKGLSVEARLAYAQEPQGLPDDLVRALRRDRRAIAPLFSPRTARLFAAQCQKALQTDVICLSHAVAAELNTMCYRSVQTCDAATGDAMATAVTRAVTGRPLEGACRSG